MVLLHPRKARRNLLANRLSHSTRDSGPDGQAGLIIPFVVLALALLAVWYIAAKGGKPKTTDLTVIDVVSRAAEFNGQSVCVNGAYRSSFNFSGLASESVNVDGQISLTGTVIWIEGRLDESGLSCNDFGECTATAIEVCGRFETGGSFGKSGAFANQLVVEN